MALIIQLRDPCHEFSRAELSTDVEQHALQLLALRYVNTDVLPLIRLLLCRHHRVPALLAAAFEGPLLGQDGVQDQFHAKFSFANHVVKVDVEPLIFLEATFENVFVDCGVRAGDVEGDEGLHEVVQVVII